MRGWRGDLYQVVMRVGREVGGVLDQHPRLRLIRIGGRL